jgi:cation:H+ antiporter
MATTISAATSGNLPLAAGNLIGGIATATMVLVICDVFAPRPLTYLVRSLVPVLEGLLVILLIAIASLGALLPHRVAMYGISPASVAWVLAWIRACWC